MYFSPTNMIHYASLLLPFANEAAIILTESKLPLFNGFYRECVNAELLESNKIKLILKHKTCDFKDDKIKMFVDFIAYIGIMLFICKNTLHYGYVTGVCGGVVMVVCSMMLTTMYLGKIVKYFTKIFNVVNPYLFILIGMFVVSGFILLTNFLEMITQQLTKGIYIDPEQEDKIEKKKA